MDTHVRTHTSAGRYSYPVPHTTAPCNAGDAYCWRINDRLVESLRVLRSIGAQLL